MEQHHYSKVSFPLRWKLLISVIALLIAIMAFLNFSTIFLIKDDKRAYTYQVQAIESILVGREFSNTANRALDILRQALATFNPDKPINANQKGILQSIVDNQPQLVALDLRFLNGTGGDSKTIFRTKKKDFPDDQLPLFEEEKKWINDGIGTLAKRPFTFINLSRVGLPPLIGVAYADTAQKNHPNGIPVALGILSLEGFLKDLKGSNFTVADPYGWVLLSSNPSVTVDRKNISKDPLFLKANATRISSGALEFDLDQTEYLGSYFKPGLNLTVLTRTPWKQAMQSTYGLIAKILFLVVMGVAAGIIFAILFAKSITAPLRKLYTATREVASGNFDLEVKTETKDEIGALSSSFNVMSQKIRDLIEESMEKVRLEGELAIASTVQQTLIPPTKFKNNNIYIQSHYEPASECGGDWWGFFEVGPKIVILIADATGHGLPSALITAAARSCFSVMHKLALDDPHFMLSPGNLLSFANRAIHDAASGKIMMTFFASIIDFSEGTMTYANGGHNPPWLFQKSGNRYKMNSLVAKGTRLGESLNNSNFQEKTIKINPNDVIFFYTDGVLEGMNTSGVQYGKKRLRNIINKNVEAGPELIVKALMDDFKKHNGDKPLDDDVTVASALILPKGRSPGTGMGTNENFLASKGTTICQTQAKIKQRN